MLHIPEDVVKKLSDFDKALTSLEDALDDHLQSQHSEQTTLDKAKSELTTLFAVNSLYWAFLHCKGKDPSQSAELAVELKRTKEYMAKLKQYEDLDKRPKYDGKTAKRFVKHALFDLNSDVQSSSFSNKFTQSSINKENHAGTLNNSNEVTLLSGSEDDDIEVIENVKGKFQNIPTKKNRKRTQFITAPFPTFRKTPFM
ncbi:hypothetical protein Mgra_00001817 [Meloidogyne graminicola]|uniref:Nuclear nucleic acid-binding protein C1D n=1 Tax=Meloidogyne graminicola TaxID=189291 RepID=A0A8T0A0C4_9BILA|nr:hypothetical protein Mgra_00001817 [Meloidogyne graminicola]